MAFKLRKNLVTILDAQAANGFGTSMDVKDFKDLLLQVSGENSADLRVRVQASLSDEAPDFTAAASSTNHWDYISVFDIQDGILTTGDTGIVFSGTDDFRNVIINTDAATFINCQVDNYVAGDVTVKLQRNTID